MKRYLYNYQTIASFDAPVESHFFKLRCVPCDNNCQQVESHDLLLHPTQSVSHDVDSWGNRVQYGCSLAPHDHFVFVSSGVVRQEECGIDEPGKADVFRVQSHMTAMSAEMAALLPTDGAHSPLAKALRMADAVYNAMAYTPGATTMGTTASQAFAMRQGVCQDYAHILLALCRAKGLAARYANGFVTGEGATHAWVEVLDGGQWWGVDPTNNRQVGTGYIKVAHGRDAHDCPVTRGVFTGQATQRTEIRVIVEEL